MDTPPILLVIAGTFQDNHYGCGDAEFDDADKYDGDGKSWRRECTYIIIQIRGSISSVVVDPPKTDLFYFLAPQGALIGQYF